MTPNRSTLLDFLQRNNTTPEAKLLLKRSFQAFVIEYGWWYQPNEFPNGIAAGTSQECFTNVVNLSQPDDSLIYCEGSHGAGSDEMDAAQGRGWASLDRNEIAGMIIFHRGNESEFKAKRK